MTKKLFVATAQIIAAEPDHATRQRLANAFASVFAQGNKAFNRSRFMEACILMRIDNLIASQRALPSSL